VLKVLGTIRSVISVFRSHCWQTTYGIYFNRNIEIEIYFGGPFNRKCWYILWPLDIFYCHLEYFFSDLSTKSEWNCRLCGLPGHTCRWPPCPGWPARTRCRWCAEAERQRFDEFLEVSITFNHATCMHSVFKCNCR
jgi:hypothetical protein